MNVDNKYYYTLTIQLCCVIQCSCVLYSVVCRALVRVAACACVWLSVTACDCV